MRKERPVLLFLFACAFALAIFLSLALSLQYSHEFFSAGKEARKVEQIICTIEGQEQEISLPAIIKDLPSRSLVVLEGEIQTQGEESLLVTSHFSHAEIYLNNILAYTFWQEGSYPPFMIDPLFGHVIIPIPENTGLVQFRVEYLSPVQRRELSIPAIYAGREGALINMLFYEKGVTVLFSLFMIFFGVLLFMIWAIFLRNTPSGASFLWLGLFSMSAGAWVLGECELSAILIPYPFLLYVMDYLGMFCVCIPLLRFWTDHPQAQVKKPLEIMLYIHYISVLAALFLQLTGAVDLMKSLYWFHIISPLAFVILAGVLLLEYFYYHNATARYFAPAGILLAVFVVLELMNYWLGLSYSFTALFQVGLLAFILWLGFISGYFIRQSTRTAFERKQLAYEVTAMGHQLALQQEQYERLMQNSEAIKALRHDIRHHIAVIKGLFSGSDIAELNQYVEQMEHGLMDTKEKIYCTNSPVNAVVTHYLSLAENEGITVKTCLDVPGECGTIPSIDICIIMGNLLENALEACRRLEDGNRFIHIRSLIAGDTLSIVISNSFDGIFHKSKDSYLSRKTNTKLPRMGIGLSSAKAICEKYHGIIQCKIDKNIWKTSVLVYMQEETSTE